MPKIIDNIRDNLLGYLITAVCSFLGFLLVGIFSDFLPVILPQLQKLPITLYLRTILLLLTLLALLISILIVFIFQSKPSIPSAISGKYCGVKYIAQIDGLRLQRDGEVIIYISWHCPIHKTVLQNSSEIINGESISTNYCKACKKHYKFLIAGAYLNWNEATRIIQDEIRHKIKLK